MTRTLSQLFCVTLLLLCFCSNTSAQSDQPALYGILLDNSGSLRSQFERVLALGNGVVQDVNKQGPISIFSFRGAGNPKDAPPLMVVHTVWNQDPVVLSRSLDSLFIEGGQTNLLDAIHSMVNHINAKAEQDKTPQVRKFWFSSPMAKTEKARSKRRNCWPSCSSTRSRCLQSASFRNWIRTRICAAPETRLPSS